MKTQISHLRSGTKNQILNPDIDYSKIPQATSHLGHAGSNQNEVDQTWTKVIAENPESIKAIIKGMEFMLTANWSLSRKSVNYSSDLPRVVLEEIFGLTYSGIRTPYIAIHSGNLIEVSNGNKAYSYICPSLITIL